MNFHSLPQQRTVIFSLLAYTLHYIITLIAFFLVRQRLYYIFKIRNCKRMLAVSDAAITNNCRILLLYIATSPGQINILPLALVIKKESAKVRVENWKGQFGQFTRHAACWKVVISFSLSLHIIHKWGDVSPKCKTTMDPRHITLLRTRDHTRSNVLQPCF